MSSILDTGQGRYWGCYYETPGQRAFFVSAGTYDPYNINPTSCTAACKRWGFRFAGMSGGNNCFCSNVLPTVANSSDGYCNMRCSDTSSLTYCGGFSYVR